MKRILLAVAAAGLLTFAFDTPKADAGPIVASPVAYRSYGYRGGYYGRPYRGYYRGGGYGYRPYGYGYGRGFGMGYGGYGGGFGGYSGFGFY